MICRHYDSLYPTGDPVAVERRRTGLGNDHDDRPVVKHQRQGSIDHQRQPNVNSAPSDDPTFGWVGPGGYVYQKVMP